ncbi:MAG: transporter [Bacteroidota bacterium]
MTNLRDMKKVYLSIVISLLSSHTLISQYSETINTSRPGQAVIPFTTGKYVFQVQSGMTYSDFDDSDLTTDGNSADFFTLLRYGLMENFELRSAFGFNSSEVNFENNTSADASGFSVWNVGIRYNIVSGEGYKPSFGFQTGVGLNWVGEDFKAEDLAPKFTLIHSQQLSKVFGLTTNWALNWNGNDNSTTGSYVINISFPLGDRLGSFVENYGTISNGSIDHRWDTGLGYLANNNLMFDCSVGYGKNDGLSDWFIDAGVSWRVKVK